MRKTLEKIAGPKKQTYQAAGIDKVALAKSLGVDPEKEKGCFEFLEKALDGPLPEPWTEQIDTKKRVYYWNSVSRHASWQHPLAGTHKALVVAYRRIAQADDKAKALEVEIEAFHRQAEDEIAQWRKTDAPDGTPYFYKVGTRLVRWDDPRNEVLAHMEVRVSLLAELRQEIFAGKSPQGKKKRKKKDSSKAREREDRAAEKLQAQARVWLRRRALKTRRRKVVDCQRLIRGFLGRARARRRLSGVHSSEGEPGSPGSVVRYRASATGESLAVSQHLLGSGDMSSAVVPAEVALNLGLDYRNNDEDRAIEAIMRELFLRPLPFPWRALRREHGRADYFHTTMREERRQHPLFSYWAEVVAFLRLHVKTNVEITDAMAAQIYREASPQVLRERLGVWEGPHEDPDVDGGVLFHLIVVGTDPWCADGCSRSDDPRMEAAANVAARLAGWQYIWAGFAPEEPFPLLVDRLGALAAQLGEAVVVAPGPAAEDLLELMASRVPAPPRPKSPELSMEEQRLQPLVVGMLGKAYGKALQAAGLEETRALREAAAASAAREAVHPEPVAEATETDPTYDEMSEEEEEEYSEHESTELSDGDLTEAEESEAESQEALGDTMERSASPSRATSPHGFLAGRLFDDEELRPFAEEPREVMGFLPSLRLESAADWAEQALRPLTPAGDRRQFAQVPASPGPPPRNLARLGMKRELWSEHPAAPAPIPELSIGALVNGPPEEDTAETVELPAAVPEAHAVGGASPAAPLPAAPATAAPGSLNSPGRVRVRALGGEAREKVDSFSKSLLQSTSAFDDIVAGTAEAPDTEEAWRLRRAEEEEAELKASREDLRKVRIPPKGGQFEEGVVAGTDPDVQVTQGACARVATPQSGEPPLPSYLRALTAAVKPRPPQGMTRPRSAERMSRRTARPGPERRDKRPDSAEPRARRAPPLNLVPERPDPQLAAAAQSVKRFLSRTCGTMSFALRVFDPSGDGRFDRKEWETGLQRLGYTPLCDPQALFSVLDKRKHYVLTLSDLLDKYSGMDVFTGIPLPGLSGIASEILHEAMSECLAQVMKEALCEQMHEALLQPSGPQNALPDVKKWLKKREAAEKKRRAQARADKNRVDKDGVPIPGSPDGAKGSSSKMQATLSGTGGSLSRRGGSPKGKRGKPGGDGSRPCSSHATDPFLRSGMSMSSSSKSLGGKSGRSSRSPKTPGGRKGAGGRKSPQSSRKGSPSSRRGSPSPGGGKKGLARAGTRGGHRADQGSGDGWFQSGSRFHARFSAGSVPSMLFDSAEGKRRGPARASGAQQAQLGSKPGGRRVTSSLREQKEYYNHYSGYRFVENEFPEEPNEKLLRFCPRPIDDVVKTYGHIFRMLGDSRAATGKPKQQKRSVHVSVPRLPGPPDGGGDMSRPDSPFFEHDGRDAERGRGLQHARSSPGLVGRPGSGGTMAGAWTLPPLSSSQSLRPDIDPMASPIDTETRRTPPQVLAGVA